MTGGQSRHSDRLRARGQGCCRTRRPTDQEISDGTGGSDAFVVMPSADIAHSAKVGVTARINNNGQSCIAGKRFIIHEDIYDAWVEAFVADMGALVMGDPMDPATQVGPLATPETGQREIADLVDDAKAKGATVLLGGDTPPRRGVLLPSHHHCRHHARDAHHNGGSLRSPCERV